MKVETAPPSINDAIVMGLLAVLLGGVFLSLGAA